MSPPQPGDRPVAFTDAGGIQQSDGNFSWFLTVSPNVSPPPQGVYSVAAVVCYKRNLSAAGEDNTQVNVLPGGYGGVTITALGKNGPPHGA